MHVIPQDSSANQAAIAGSMISAILREHAAAGLTAAPRVHIERGEPGPTLVRMSAGADQLIIGACCNAKHRGIFSGAVVPFCLRRALCPVQICADHGERFQLRPDNRTSD